jgi:hypothetical protein
MRLGRVLALLSAAGSADAAPVVPRFVDETTHAGIDHACSGDWEFIVGGGAAAFDCDADGFPDLLLAGGAAPARFYRNASTVGGPLRFTEQKSGLEAEDVTGAYPLDVNSDGTMDVILLRVGESLAMRGQAAAASSAPTRPGASTAATPGRRPLRRPGSGARHGRRWRSAPTSTGARRCSPGAPAPTTDSTGRRRTGRGSRRRRR